VSEPTAPESLFATFIIGLAQSALLHLGVMPDPDTNVASPNPPLAEHTIDLIAMLRDKAAELARG